MDNSEYETLIDNTLLAIEEALDTCDADLDYENSNGILTIEFNNHSKIIINRQAPVQQLWIAAKAGGFHLDYNITHQTWLTDSANGEDAQGEALFPLLSRLCSQQAGIDLILNQS